MYHHNYLNALQLALAENKRIRTRIDPLLDSLFAPHISRSLTAFEPATNAVNWVSLTAGDLIDETWASNDRLALMVDRAASLLSERIEGAFMGVLDELLCEMPDAGTSELWSSDYFWSHTQAVCQNAASQLRTRSANIEDAVNEMLQLLIQQLNDDDDDDDEEHCSGVNGLYNY